MFNPCMNASGPIGHPNGPLPQPQNGPPPGPTDPAFYNPGPLHPMSQFNPAGPPPQGHPPPNAFPPNGPRPMAAMHPHQQHMHPPSRPAFFAGPSPDLRIHELNKRLQNRSEEWSFWDQFANDFFDDEATLTIALFLEDGPKKYTIGRTLIPRYFRSFFDGGVQDLSFQLRYPKESATPTTIAVDCEHCTIIAYHGKAGMKVMPSFPQEREISCVVMTEGQLLLEFTRDELMRIRNWSFHTRQHQEFMLRNLLHVQDPVLLEQFKQPLTRQGHFASTINFLRIGSILEPMQLLMSRHKALSFGMTNCSPRDCLKQVLFDKWQRTYSPPEAQRPASKRRKRKSNANATGTTGTTGKKKSTAQMSPSGTPNFSLASQDVMVVGEPSLMGGEFGEEDERIITRLENTQYDANAVAANGLVDEQEEFGGHAPTPSMLGGPQSGPPSNNSVGSQQQGQGPSSMPSTPQGNVGSGNGHGVVTGGPGSVPQQQPGGPVPSGAQQTQWTSGLSQNASMPVNGSGNSGNNSDISQQSTNGTIQGNVGMPVNQLPVVEDKKPSPINQ